MKLKSERITRDQWLLKALELFGKSGEGGLHIEKLARAIGVSKSGFYWHFRDRDDLLDQLLDYWAHEYTDVVAGNPLFEMAPPRRRLIMIATAVFEQNLTKFDVAFFTWANKEPAIARRVSKVIESRMNFTRQAFSELGFEGDDLEMRASTFLGYLTLERQLYGNGKKKVQELRELRIDMLCDGRGKGD